MFDLDFKLDLDWVEMNLHDKYLGQGLFYSEVVITETHISI